MKNIERNIPYKPEVLSKLHDTQIEMLNDLDDICSTYGIQYFAIFGTALGAIRHNGFIPWDDDIDVAMLREDYDKFMEVMTKIPNEKYKILTPEVDKNYACCVTKFQKKGTKFVSFLSDKLKCDQCIFIDIFPFDYVAPTEKLLKRQQFKTLFFDRLIYLCGSAHPIIPYSGIKHDVYACICWLAHYGLKILHVSPKWLYGKFVDECKKYNDFKSEEITSFGESISLNYRMKASSIYPIERHSFENTTIPIIHCNETHLKKTYGDYMMLPPEDKRVNHAPYIIDFGDDKES